MRKTLIAIITVAMLLPLFCFSIAAEPEGTPIKTADEFMAMKADGNYYLANDIVLNDTWGKGSLEIVASTGYERTAIDPEWRNLDAAVPFTGTFDGNGKTITVSKPMFCDFSGTAKNFTIAAAGNGIESAYSAAPFAIVSTLGFTIEDVTNNCPVSSVGVTPDTHSAGIVCWTANNVLCTFTNVVNNANISQNINDGTYLRNSDGTLVMDNSNAIQYLKPRLGGLAGVCNNGKFVNCVNNGDIVGIGYQEIAGGLVARIALQKGSNSGIFLNCVNNGKVVGDCKSERKYSYDGDGKQVNTVDSDKTGPYTLYKSGTYAGGIAGYLGCSGNVGLFKCLGCVNNGDVVSGYEVGGFFGYAYASGANAYCDLQFCINNGDVYFGRPGKYNADGDLVSQNDFGSDFIGYTNSTSTVIMYCISTAEVKRNEGSFENAPIIFVGCSSAPPIAYVMGYNYLVNLDKYEYFSYATSDDNAANRVKMDNEYVANKAIKTTLEELKSGKVAYEINSENIKFDYRDNKTMFFQQLGVDDLPTVDTGKSAFFISYDGTQYTNIEQPDFNTTVTEPEETEDEETNPPKTTAPVENTTPKPEDKETTPAEVVTTKKPDESKPSGGCGSVSLAVVVAAMVTVIGGAVVVIKKH